MDENTTIKMGSINKGNQTNFTFNQTSARQKTDVLLLTSDTNNCSMNNSQDSLEIIMKIYNVLTAHDTIFSTAKMKASRS